jgi:hypothetical protein
VVAKMDVHRGKALRGYIAMLTVEQEHRYLGVGELAGGGGARGGTAAVGGRPWCWTLRGRRGHARTSAQQPGLCLLAVQLA